MQTIGMRYIILFVFLTVLSSCADKPNQTTQTNSQQNIMQPELLHGKFLGIPEEELLRDLENEDRKTYQNMDDKEKSFLLRTADRFAKKSHQQALERYDQQLMNQK